MGLSPRAHTRLRACVCVRVRRMCANRANAPRFDDPIFLVAHLFFFFFVFTQRHPMTTPAASFFFSSQCRRTKSGEPFPSAYSNQEPFIYFPIPWPTVFKFLGDKSLVYWQGRKALGRAVRIRGVGLVVDTGHKKCLVMMLKTGKLGGTVLI